MDYGDEGAVLVSLGGGGCVCVVVGGGVGWWFGGAFGWLFGVAGKHLSIVIGSGVETEDNLLWSTKSKCNGQ